VDRSLALKIQTANTAIIADRNLEVLEEFFTPDYVAHVTDRDGGLDVIRRFIGMLHSAFPDLQAEVEILVEGESRVAWQRTLRGTQEGDFLGFPATGRRIVWRDMVTSRFRDGRIAEEWAITDLAERLLEARKG
jgi:predicted ester cyclase